MIQCDDETDRTPLWAALVTAVATLGAAVLPGALERHHERAREREELLRELERLRAREEDEE